MGTLAELSDRVLANIIRSGLSSVLARDEPAKKGQDRIPRGLIGITNHRSIPKLLNVREVASLLRCHPETIYRQIKAEHLPAKRHCNRWKFDPIEIADWLEQHSAKRNKAPAGEEAHGNTG